MKLIHLVAALGCLSTSATSGHAEQASSAYADIRHVGEEDKPMPWEVITADARSQNSGHKTSRRECIFSPV